MPVFQLHIKGKVQGVFYRASAHQAARRLGVTGWIRNTPDGAVAAVVSGPGPAVARFIDWCRKGPVNARVTEVVVTEAPEAHFKEFAILEE